jgi:hypothetical protein
MSHILAIAARELRERWILFPAGLALGFVPLVHPAFGVPREGAPTLGLITALCLGAAAALVMGSSMLARDAASGRLGFLFSRPVSWRAIWTGKWLAAVVLVFGTAMLASVPWMAVYPPDEAGGGSWLAAMKDGPGTLLAVALVFVALGLSNFGATAFRSRSAWFAVDLLAVVAATWAVRHVLPPLLRYWPIPLAWFAGVLTATVALALLVGSLGQLVLGRTDLRRAHLASSMGTWAVVWTGLGAAAAFVVWVRAAPPSELRAFAVTRDPVGRWIYVEGSARVPGVGFPQSAFLIDTSTGHFARGSEGAGYLAPVAFAADGRVALNLRRARDERGSAVELMDLAASPPTRTFVALETNLPVLGRHAFAVSPAADRIFYAHEGGASVFELPSGRRLATASMPPGFWPLGAVMVGRDLGRAWLVPLEPRREMRVLDISPDGASAIRTFGVAAPLSAWDGAIADSTGSRLLTFDAGVRLRDGADGRLIATLVEDGGIDTLRRAERFAVTFLSDGRIVMVGAVPRDGTGGPRVSVFDTDGAKVHDAVIALEPAGLSVGPELPGGRVIVSSSPLYRTSPECLIFDANTGAATQNLGSLRPASYWPYGSAAPPGRAVAAVHFFHDTEGRLLRIDLASGERRVVAGPGAPEGERLRWN